MRARHHRVNLISRETGPEGQPAHIATPMEPPPPPPPLLYPLDPCVVAVEDLRRRNPRNGGASSAGTPPAAGTSLRSLALPCARRCNTNAAVMDRARVGGGPAGAMRPDDRRWSAAPSPPRCISGCCYTAEANRPPLPPPPPPTRALAATEPMCHGVPPQPRATAPR